MKSLTLTVAQFNTFIKNILSAEEFLYNVQIVGEVTNFKISGSNAYFDLKDDGALLSCIKFDAGFLNIKNGDKVSVCGRINFYVKSGRLNFIVSKIESYGLGALYQKFLELKQKLESEGYFRQDLKKEIPHFAFKIGVVTSETGAVIRDIIHVTRSKNPYTDIVVYPSKVQGQDAEKEIVAGIKYFDGRDDIDTIIIARGGGSLEDLSPFNTEVVVKAIFDCQKPIISAVGHETDFTLCDFASDLRVPTPSVAGEVAVFDYYAEVEQVKSICSYNSYAVSKLISQSKDSLVSTSLWLIDKLNLKLQSSYSNVFSITKDITSLIQSRLGEKKSNLDVVVGALSKQNPLEILKRGYLVVEKNGLKINSAKNLKVGDSLTLKLLDGEVDTIINGVRVKKWNMKKL